MSYSDDLKKWAARRKQAVKLYANGKLSMREVGLKLDPPVTHTSVRKMLVKEGVLKATEK